jgi:hypothetical protein
LLKPDGRDGAYGLVLGADVEGGGAVFGNGNEVALFSGASGGGALVDEVFVAAGWPFVPSR